MRESASRFTRPLLLVLFLSGCSTVTRPAPRYIVTATPVDVATDNASIIDETILMSTPGTRPMRSGM